MKKSKQKLFKRKKDLKQSLKQSNHKNFKILNLMFFFKKV